MKNTISDKEFRDSVRKAIKNIKCLDKIADELQVSACTIRRWASWVARPHPELRNKILAIIKAIKL